MNDSIDIFDPHSEGAFARFDKVFIGRFGTDSMLVKALSDLWTIALARMLLEHEAIDPDKPLMLYSNDKAVDAVRALFDKTRPWIERCFKSHSVSLPLEL